MPEQRSLRFDLLALALFAFCVFFGVALATYNPADFPSTVTYPPPGAVSNSCGRSGAFVAEWTFRLFGVSAWFVLVSLSVLDALLLRRRKIGEPVIRTIGWLMALVGICTLASLVIARPATGPVIGPGGYVGAAGRTILEMNFAAIGSYVLTLSVMAAGLLLCTDYVLVRLTALVVGKPTVIAARLGHRALRGGRAFLKSNRSANRWPASEEQGQAVRS